VKVAAPYHFSISPTCGFAFRDSAGTCIQVEYTPHPAPKGLSKKAKGIKSNL